MLLYFQLVVAFNRTVVAKLKTDSEVVHIKNIKFGEQKKSLIIMLLWLKKLMSRKGIIVTHRFC